MILCAKLEEDIRDLQEGHLALRLSLAMTWCIKNTHRAVKVFPLRAFEKSESGADRKRHLFLSNMGCVVAKMGATVRMLCWDGKIT